MSTNPAKNILKNDSRFAKVPSFDELRERGLEHIAELSGNLWTDHNLHDPGITLLELLCYALTDLGYRTSLETGDLFAPPPEAGTDTSFFTPAEILTNNPVTILDYRKMLVDVPGVRNAWLEKATEQEVPLSYRKPTREDCDPRALYPRLPAGDEFAEVKLSGLYRVLLDLDPRLTQNADGCGDGGNTFGGTLAEVERRLQAHRNLCEDFTDIQVLRNEAIALCLDLDLEPKAAPGPVLSAVFAAVEEFISPRIRFSNLADLLAAGKSIEEIYRGRPYLKDYVSATGRSAPSHGFVDVAQLADLRRPTELRASDLYRVIMNVEGVRAIRELKLVNFLDGKKQTQGEDWILPLTPDHRPLFAPELGHYTFHKGALRVPFPADEVIARFRRRLGDYRKTPLAADELDRAIPYGNHRGDLGDHLSVQHELPVTYGVGEGDLSRDATPARRAQVLQLRGFLSFFDQFLANYCGQLFHTREIYSWRSGTKQTLFSQAVDGAPGGAELLRFPPAATQKKGAAPALVRSLVPYAHPLDRDQAIAALINEFRNLSLDELRDRMRVEEAADRTFHLVFTDGCDRPTLRGLTDFRLRESAEAEGDRIVLQLIYQGGVATNYRADNYPADRCYAFTILDGETDYATFLRTITESPTSFAANRNRILDHLLARFNESFTDYVLLNYALNQASPDSQRIIRDKERFLKNYPKISRERGKGFDQQRPEARDNRSGLEQRVGHLMGHGTERPGSLNPFSVVEREQAFRLVWRGHRGRVLLRTSRAYPLDADRVALEAQLLDRLADPTAYRKEDCPEEASYRYYLTDPGGRPLAEFPGSNVTAELRDAHLACSQAYFRKPCDLWVMTRAEESAYGFDLNGEEMTDGQLRPTVFWRSETTYPTAAEATAAGQTLLSAVRSGNSRMTNFGQARKGVFGLRLRGGDVSARSAETVATTEARKALRESRKRYHEALLAPCPGLRLALCADPRGYFFQLPGPEGVVYLRTTEHFAEEAVARRAGRSLLRLAAEPSAYLPTATGRFGFTVVSADGTSKGEHPTTYATAAERDEVLATVRAYFSERRLDYRLEAQAPRYVWCFTAGATLVGQVPFTTEEDARGSWTASRETLATTARWEVLRDADGNWHIEVSRRDGLPLATGGPFADEAAANTARATFRAAIARGETTGLGTRRTQASWNFRLRYRGKEVLRGTRTYPDRDAAADAFLAFSKLAAGAENYRDRPDPDGCLLSFAVVDATGEVAYHPEFLSPATARELRRAVIAYVADNFVDCAVGYQEFRWTYELGWEDCYGRCAPLLVSAGTGWESATAAKLAAKELTERLRDPAALEDWTAGGGYHFGVSTEDGPLAEHPETYPSAAERDRVREDAVAYFADYFRRCASSAGSFLAEDELFVYCHSRPVCCEEEEDPDAGPAGADHYLSTYRLSAAEPVATHPEILPTAATRDQLVADLHAAATDGQLAYVNFFGAHTQVPGKDRVTGKPRPGRFHYEWRAEGLPSWYSVRSYATAEAAEAAFSTDFPKLLTAGNQPKSYRELGLRAYLDKLRHPCWPEAKAGPFTDYASPAYAEGDFLTLVDKDGFPLVYLPNSTGAKIAENRRAWRECIRRYPYRCLPGKGWRYHTPDPSGGEDWLRGTAHYPTLLEARRAYAELLDLLRYRANYRPDDAPEAGIFRLAITATLLDGKMIYADPEQEAGTEDFCSTAWTEGLPNFLLYGTEEDNYYDFLDGGENCRHGFRVVRPGYRLARSPQESHTPAERERLLDWLYHYATCRQEKSDRVYDLCTSFGADTYRAALRAPNGEVHWRTATTFLRPDGAGEYWRAHRIEWLGYAQEPDCYRAGKACPDADGNPRYRLQLRNEAGEVVLESARVFLREAISDAVRERVLLARKFPLYLYEGVYGFQCFSHEDLPDFRQETSDSCKPTYPAPAAAPGEEPAETRLCDGELELHVRVPGTVVWESTSEYADADAARTAYRCFLRLLADRRNYQRQQLTDCNLFRIELTRPDYALAEHPRRYAGEETRERAKSATLARVNGEGMYLVEHLLLRPLTMTDRTIPNVCPAVPPVIPDGPEACPHVAQWHRDLTDKLPVEASVATATEPAYVPGADPYSYWATIVLPYWPHRFQNANFRSFFADTLRREVPAHVALRICWLDPKQLREFEHRYRRWLVTRNWDDDCGRNTAQGELVDFLFSMTSALPPARLLKNDCDAPGVTEAGAVLLGSTQLS